MLVKLTPTRLKRRLINSHGLFTVYHSLLNCGCRSYFQQSLFHHIFNQVKNLKKVGFVLTKTLQTILETILWKLNNTTINFAFIQICLLLSKKIKKSRMIAKSWSSDGGQNNYFLWYQKKESTFEGFLLYIF